MPADVSYIEIGASNASETRVFLQELFGWDFHPFGGGAEGFFQTPTIKAGIHGDDPSPGLLVFFGVPDLEAAIMNVNRLGGATETATEEPGFGRFCLCRDPRGLLFGLHQRWLAG